MIPGAPALWRRVQVVLHNLESFLYSTDDAQTLEGFLRKLEDLQQSFRLSLLSKDGLTVLPAKSVPSLLAKKVKKNALKHLQRATKLSSLLDAEKKRPGRKRQNWKIRTVLELQLINWKSKSTSTGMMPLSNDAKNSEADSRCRCSSLGILLLVVVGVHVLS